MKSILKRLYWTWSIYRDCNRTPANREYWTGSKRGRVTLWTAWGAARHIGQYRRDPS